MYQILLANSLPKETVSAIMMLYKNTMVCSPDDDNTYFFDIVTRVLQGDALTFIICLDYILKTSIDLMKENGLTLKIKGLARSR